MAGEFLLLGKTFNFGSSLVCVGFSCEKGQEDPVCKIKFITAEACKLYLVVFSVDISVASISRTIVEKMWMRMNASGCE